MSDSLQVPLYFKYLFIASVRVKSAHVTTQMNLGSILPFSFYRRIENKLVFRGFRSCHHRELENIPFAGRQRGFCVSGFSEL